MKTFLDSELQLQVGMLKHRKKQFFWYYLWRSLAIVSSVSGLLFVATSSQWSISEPDRISIQGNSLIDKETIHSFLGMKYPQFIWQIPIDELSDNLKSPPPIKDVRVSKQIFPPQIEVNLIERQPVAIAVSSGKIGFLDPQGVWLEPKFYKNPDPQKLGIKIKVINFHMANTQHWSQLYKHISHYQEINLQEVKWDSDGNLFLKTQIGNVYLGSDISLLEKQVSVLARFPKLTTTTKLNGTAFLDLSNPDVPFIQKYPQAEF